jgi:hypothetical protein
MYYPHKSFMKLILKHPQHNIRQPRHREVKKLTPDHIAGEG